MKIKLYIILIGLFLFQSCTKLKIENDLTRNNLKGEVFNYSEFSYAAEAINGIIKKGRRKKERELVEL